ncbi:MAG: hypothetical protein AAGF12_38155 [Myxococcota bacterium]
MSLLCGFLIVGAMGCFDIGALELEVGATRSDWADAAADADTGVPSIVEPAGCGVVGGPCCSGQRCDEGACLGGTCASFGGVHVAAASCGGCLAGNPYAAGCACPAGFGQTEVGMMMRGCGGGILSLCASTASTADFLGAFLATDGSCNPECLTPHPDTGGCVCPAGAEAIELTTRVESGCGAQFATLTLCARGGVAPTTFAGAWQVQPTTGRGCRVPNPRTGACSCPSGTTDLIVDSSPVAIHLCIQ